jgi:hypothetical protein
VKTGIVKEKGVPEGEGGFSITKMVNVYRYAIDAEEN